MPLTQNEIRVIEVAGKIESAKTCFKAVRMTKKSEAGLRLGLRYLYSATTILGRIIAVEK